MIILSTFNEFISVLLSYGKNKTEILRFLVEVYVERLSSDIKFDKVDHVKLVFVSPPVVSLSKKLYHYCSVLVGSSNGFELDITIVLK